MDKKIAGLLGAAAALTAVNSAQAAAPTTVEPAATYRDLLEPIPNALAMLKSEDAQGTAPPASGQTRLAQHHHHHHHRYRRPAYHHHHHHRYYHHHHHHHHHN
jgi:hypothetical protein